VDSGAIGTPTQVQVSSTQQYHAVALIRGLLAAGRGAVSVRAARFTAPLVSPLSRSGWTDDEEPHPATTTIATLDFGNGRSGVYDFTDQQTRNQLRFRRLTVRGSAGELHNDEVVRMTGPRTLVRTPLVRRQTGYDLDLIGYDTEHISLGSEVLYRNPYPGRRWMDDEIAMATLLERTASWVRGEGPEPYPLAEGAQDQLVALAIEESADRDYYSDHLSRGLGLSSGPRAGFWRPSDTAYCRLSPFSQSLAGTHDIHESCALSLGHIARGVMITRPRVVLGRRCNRQHRTSCCRGVDPRGVPDARSGARPGQGPAAASGS
jgi:hypothetical protein